MRDARSAAPRINCPPILPPARFVVCEGRPVLLPRRRELPSSPAPEEDSLLRRVWLVLMALAMLTAVAGTPVVSAAAGPFGVNVVSSNGYTEPDNWVTVAGEVVNNTRTSVRFVKITIDFYDEAGTNLVGTDYTYS